MNEFPLVPCVDLGLLSPGELLCLTPRVFVFFYSLPPKTNIRPAAALRSKELLQSSLSLTLSFILLLSRKSGQLRP